MPNEDISRKQQRKAAVDEVKEGDMESGPSVTFYCPFLNIERCQSEETVFVIYSILILGLIFLCSLAMTAWPQHNVILMPEYWYEPLRLYLVGSKLPDAFFRVMSTTMILNTDALRSWRVLGRLYFEQCSICILVYVSIYTIWVHGVHKRHPMPFFGLPFGRYFEHIFNVF